MSIVISAEKNLHHTAKHIYFQFRSHNATRSQRKPATDCAAHTLGGADVLLQVSNAF